MSLEEIARSIEIQESLAEMYRKKWRKQPWLIELLQQSYMLMKIKLTSDKHQYVTYESACNSIDNVVLTVVSIYEARIAELKNARTPAT